MMSLPVAQTLANVAVVTQFSPWAELDEDSAVQMLENMAGSANAEAGGFGQLFGSYRNAKCANSRGSFPCRRAWRTTRKTRPI